MVKENEYMIMESQYNVRSFGYTINYSKYKNKQMQNDIEMAGLCLNIEGNKFMLRSQ